MSSGPLRRAWRGLRRQGRLLRWGAAALPAAAGRPTGARRLLLIYDFATQPFSIGDILIFQEAALVLRERHGLGQVDVAGVYDPARPVVPDPAFAHIEAENFLFHLAGILPAAQVNPHLGSIFLFDSHRRLEAYIADNAGQYYIWPSLEQYAKGEYLFYYCFDELFAEHHARHGMLPPLRSRPAALAWARRFIRKHAGTAVPVTIQLRRNPANPDRNSDYDAWISFLRECADRYPARFFVICGRSELDPRLREIPNVTVVKEYCTSLEEDLALLEAGALHMGVASGPATMVHFSRKPYCIFKWDLKAGALKTVLKEGERYYFRFAAPLQSWLIVGETPELLRREFQRLWEGLGADGRSADIRPQ